MSTIEDKILDGPRIHYCDADNDDVRLDEVDPEDDKDLETGDAASLFRRPCEEDERLSRVKCRGNSSNTGPKGVLEDFKKRNLPKETELDELDAEFQELMNDDSIINEYIAKRINSGLPSFGRVDHLQNGDQLLRAIDDENSNVPVIVHIYTRQSKPSNMNRCLDELAIEYKHVKFVTLDATVTNLSANFKENGVPALLAYKAGELVGSLVQLEELLDKNFETSQVRELLKDNKMIPK